MNNRAHGQDTAALTERAVAALVREWGISEREARDAIDRARTQEARLGSEMHRERVWGGIPEPREPIDLTEKPCAAG